ncbi:MAG TPA: hypothetical protein VK081_04700 [Planctomycetota bacterium]|nr:hypothetical protein [Planctomycetota bacterium]
MLTRVPSLAPLALASLAAAQPLTTLVGGADQGGTTAIQRQVVCRPASVLCSPVLGLPTQRFAGGTAVDPIRQVVWDTDGLRMVSVLSTVNGGACRIVCGPMPVPGLPAGAVATGLAFEEDGTSAGALWVVDSALGLQRLTWPTRSCPGPGQRCNIAPFMPTPNHVPGGLAISEVHGAVFFSASDFSGGAPNNWVFGVRLGNPCQPFCRLQVGDCGAVRLGPITGLAFDDCTSTMYLTDGRITMVATYTPPSSTMPCQLQVVSCCTQQVGRWYGLCVEPVHATNVGRACTAAPCPNCAGSMSLNALGDASLGNAAFGYRLSGAPPGVLAFCFVNIGGCTPGIPLLCGTFHVPLAPPPVNLGAVATVGAACAANADHLLPIPLSPWLCGIQLSAQDVILCPGTTGFGVGLSNAVCTTISDT